jgi:hypothetical protein
MSKGIVIKGNTLMDVATIKQDDFKVTFDIVREN